MDRISLLRSRSARVLFVSWGFCVLCLPALFTPPAVLTLHSPERGLSLSEKQVLCHDGISECQEFHLGERVMHVVFRRKR